MERLTMYADVINSRLEQLMSVYTPDNAGDQIICADAMKYSLSAGGKRIRPVLAMEFARIFCGSFEKAIDSACALEMIHTFSLIHDDLPCIDNDDMRRGKPSCHKVFGEAIALLAGDALENYAFEVIAGDEGLSPEQRIRLIKCLSKAVGVVGMIGGQTIDIGNVGRAFDGELLLNMYSMKTGALIECACKMGCICAQAYEKTEIAGEYARKLGLAFQIIDDILDITADEAVLGKPVNSDSVLNKATYPAVFGLDAARHKAEELTKEAEQIACGFKGGEFLVSLTEYLLKRQF